MQELIGNPIRKTAAYTAYRHLPNILDKCTVYFESDNYKKRWPEIDNLRPDFMDPKNRVLFFAKIASKSSGMSHLVEQVRRTSELLFSTDPSFRKELTTKIKKLYPKADTSWLNVRPKPGEWNLCFVSLGRSKDNLPFFAKCSLVKICDDLRSRGHEVSFIDV